MVLTSMCVFIIVILYIVRFWLTKNHDYWEKRKVPFKKPLMLFGNYKETILMKKSLALVAKELCDSFPKEPYIGTFFGTDPALMIQDPELIKLVLVTDFTYFSGREITDYANRETLTKNIFFNGGDDWKIPRQNLAPLFTSAKLKGMFHLITDCAHQFRSLLEDEVRSSPVIEAKALLAKYTIDCITSCTFGVNSNTMNKSTVLNPFMIMREKMMDFSTTRSIKMYWRWMWPASFYGLRFTIFEDRIVKFFHTFLSGVFKSRESTKSYRNDFVDLLMNWKEKKVITGAAVSISKTGNGKEVTFEVTEDLLISQCVALFGAGFETTASTMCYLLFEIAKRQDIQMKVIEEVDKYFKQHDGKIEYECINELPYISACIDETLRLYPVIGLLTREVMAAYTMPTGLQLQKGNRIHIPVYKIQRDPAYFPDPEVFKPERFFGDERTFVKPFTFMPFGEGPRICIGQRFSKVPMNVGLLTIFKNYRVELSENMPRTIPFLPVSFVTTPAIDINLKFISRKN